MNHEHLFEVSIVPKSLKKGDWFLYKGNYASIVSVDGEEVTVSAHTNDEGPFQSTIPYQELQPILLDHDILLKCGFIFEPEWTDGRRGNSYKGQAYVLHNYIYRDMPLCIRVDKNYKYYTPDYSEGDSIMQQAVHHIQKWVRDKTRRPLPIDFN